MTRLDVCMFGPFQVTVDGEPATGFASDKVRALLAYLAVETSPHRREKLAGLLWPDQPERSARANLRRALSNLRLVIGDRAQSGDPAGSPPTLLVTRQTIQFNSESDAWVDVTAFAESVNEQMGKWADEQRGRGAGGGIGGLEEAVALYRGGFLEGFSLAGCPAFEEWMLFEGERLHRLALEALHRLVKGYEARGELERALPHAWRQLELDPWWESAHQQTMRLLACSGRRAESLAHYETCRQRLVEELGVGPSDETVALYERIRDGREGSTPAAGAVPHNLPAPLTPFIGREAELAELGECLRDPACRLVTLVGPGGIGKTRLALEAARGSMEDYPHGVFQVRLAGLQSAEGIVPAIAEAIGLIFHRGGDPKQQLLDYLRQKMMLLLLDNFEHLLEGVGVLVELLRAAPAIMAVVTTRTKLNLKGEHLFSVAGLEVPPLESQVALTPTDRRQLAPSPPKRSMEPWDAAQYDAVKLFLSGAGRVCPGFAIEGHATDVVTICRLTEGMPLALLLAAAWVEGMPPAEIAARLDHGLDVLETDWRDVPDRHRSVQAVFDHSWHLLTAREQEIFPALSVFRGGFDREAARTVAGATDRELQALVDKSLVHRSTPDRYEMHELLRQYGADRLRQADRLRRADKLRRADRLGQAEGLDEAPCTYEMVHDRHCAHYAAALQRWAEALKDERQLDALAAIETDADNARAAWNWAVERGQVARLDQALDGLCCFCEWRMRCQEGEAACRLAAENLARAASGDVLQSLARILIWQGAFNRLLGRAGSAARLLQEGQALLDRCALAGQKVAPVRAFLLLQRGYLEFHSDREEASLCYAKSLALYRSVGDGWGMANALDVLGVAAWYMGDHNEAQQLWQESLAIRQALGDRRGTAISQSRLSIAALWQRRFEDGERLGWESVAALRETGDRAELAYQLREFGTLLLTRGKFAESCSVLEESASIFKDLGHGHGLAFSMTMLGAAALFLGRYEGVRAQAETSLAVARETGHLRGIGNACLLLGQVALAREAYAEAHDWWQEGATLLRETGPREELALALAFQAYAARGFGDLEEARRYLHEALQIATELPMALSVLVAVPGVALLVATQGEIERAVELYALVLRHPFVANSPWFEDIAGRQIAAAAAELPVAVVAAAQARGRARDLQATVMELLEELEG